MRANLFKIQPGGLPRWSSWLRLCTSNAGGVGSIPGRGTKIPHATQCGQNLKKKIFFKLQPDKTLMVVSSGHELRLLRMLGWDGGQDMTPSHSSPTWKKFCWPKVCIRTDKRSGVLWQETKHLPSVQDKTDSGSCSPPWRLQRQERALRESAQEPRPNLLPPRASGCCPHSPARLHFCWDLEVSEVYTLYPHSSETEGLVFHSI